MNTIKEWFGDTRTPAEIKSGKVNKSFYNFYKDNFIYDTQNGIKVPRSVARKFNNLEDDVSGTVNPKTGIDYTAIMLNVLANTYISAMVSAPNAKILKRIKFSWLLEKDKDIMRQAVCKAVLHALQNKIIYERIIGTNVSTPNFSMSTDTVQWMLSGDVFGMFVRNSLNEAMIDLYEVVGSEIYTIKTNGNIQLIGRITENTLVSLPELV